ARTRVRSGSVVPAATQRHAGGLEDAGGIVVDVDVARHPARRYQQTAAFQGKAQLWNAGDVIVGSRELELTFGRHPASVATGRAGSSPGVLDGGKIGATYRSFSTIAGTAPLLSRGGDHRREGARDVKHPQRRRP